MTEISVTMLDIDEIEPDPRSHLCRGVKMPNNCCDLLVAEQSSTLGHAVVEDWLGVQDLGLATIVKVRAAVSTGMCKLQANKQPVIGACSAAMLVNQHAA